MAARKPKRVYLAGSCGKESRQMMYSIAAIIRSLGYVVYCPFELKIDEKDEYGNWKLSQEEWAMRVFEADIKAIDDCDIFLMISAGRNSTAGTNFEEGYAYAKGKKIIVIQYTLDETSLMTYGGAWKFVNSVPDSFSKILLFALTDKKCRPKETHINGERKLTRCFTNLT